jgi:hypothetical protein
MVVKYDHERGNLEENAIYFPHTTTRRINEKTLGASALFMLCKHNV